ncbi:ATP-binding protein [Nocardioides maradonensis]
MPVVIKKAGFDELLTSGEYYLKALIIGENGSGKTPFAAQWPKPLFALCENGHMSLALSHTPYADVKSSADMQALIDQARIESRKPPASRQYETFVVDTIDSYQKVLIQERLRETRQQGLSGWADWGWLDAKMQSLIEQLKALPMNVVVLMHTRDVHEKDDDNEDSDTTRVVQRARMKGDSKDSIFDNYPLVGLMENRYAAEGGQRVIKRQVRWHPDPKHPNLRDQSTRLPKTTAVNFDAGDYQQLFDAIAGDSLDAYAKTEVIQEIETPEVEAVPAAVDEVGALEKPALPKAAAKKAAAKKTAAKKAAAPVATPVENSSPAPAGAPSVAEPASATVPGQASGAGEDPWQPPLPSEADATPVEEKAAEETKPEPPKVAPGEKVCGTQPPAFAGKYPAVEGCGKPIEDSDTKSKISVVKYRTFVCGSCCDRLASK